MHVLAAEGEDGVAALESLPRHVSLSEPLTKAELPLSGELTPESICHTLVALLPEGPIVSDEMASNGEAVNPALQNAGTDELLPVTADSIGPRLPVTAGAELAYPDRKLFAIEADGSAMYSPQALRMMARENHDVLVVIFNNRRYHIPDVGG